ncbi:hypothetical protein [Paraburkholderia xenovorans]
MGGVAGALAASHAVTRRISTAPPQLPLSNFPLHALVRTRCVHSPATATSSAVCNFFLLLTAAFLTPYKSFKEAIAMP